MTNTYRDEPIYRYMFVNLRTDEPIGLPVSKYSIELTKMYNRRYYSSIEEMKEDYDLLYIEDDIPNQVGLYIDVKKRFVTLSRENLPHDEINRLMQEEFNKKAKQKTL